MSTRKRYFIHHRFQSEFTVKMMIAILLPVIVCTIYMIAYINLASANTAEISNISFWFSFSLRVLPVIFIVAVFSILFTHRIAGPIRRMQTACEELVDGRGRDEIRLRRNDYFHTMADKLNTLAENRSANQ